jgi:hypothetical protein
MVAERDPEIAVTEGGLRVLWARHRALTHQRIVNRIERDQNEQAAQDIAQRHLELLTAQHAIEQDLALVEQDLVEAFLAHPIPEEVFS